MLRIYLANPTEYCCYRWDNEIIFASYTICNRPFPQSTDLISAYKHSGTRVRLRWAFSYGTMVCWNAGKLNMGLENTQKTQTCRLKCHLHGTVQCNSRARLVVDEANRLLGKEEMANTHTLLSSSVLFDPFHFPSLCFYWWHNWRECVLPVKLVVSMRKYQHKTPM